MKEARWETIVPGFSKIKRFIVGGRKDRKDVISAPTPNGMEKHFLSRRGVWHQCQPFILKLSTILTMLKPTADKASCPLLQTCICGQGHRNCISQMADCLQYYSSNMGQQSGKQDFTHWPEVMKASMRLFWISMLGLTMMRPITGRMQRPLHPSQSS